MVSAYSVFLSAFNYAFAELPLFRSLGPTRSTKKFMSAVSMGVVLATVLYSCTAFIAVFLFGSSI